ncbi:MULTISPECIES: TonB-dependent receptor domain-containing protein [unclassified Novosphingobium]|uniref:TonB-dependent receptor plug domain-containing protein n=1 Tax=unclassified Novosphingobium TaxID=2644732 RepID=UPI001494A301|nr:vitamin B12 transporter [Novosphingobium sp. BK256]MBB3373098.1 vitamin B12 transporter [Novosphingobium sp. BK280]MBB3377466.1 vitamin B12 transporter [Novosphingobium sp. BK258]MBB3419123.1 vitamin B12 transporter [Novosphingobium sp. BK267]MBB3449060.1 vitamin B12 transporter [Novosphingobium sp. BK352]MBB3476383.1 vitamin B12 transporter [Novosphingobium sp. BK369]MBB3499604.1 vitamin B12 transporter [Novosphingobium sp. BK336]MBB3535389.1 vitamin B12 transporter [Novosphingobium sp. 
MKTSLVALATAVMLAAPAYADEAPAADGAQITVLATGNDLSLDQTGQAITVLPLQTIEAVQGVDLTRVLDRVPGLTWSRTGGLGAQTAVRLRGGEGQHTLVLVDGVRVEDPSAPSGGFDFGTLTSGGIERIEVLRGSNSVVWGSSAIGGVIAVTTREIDGVEASAEAGSRRSYDADAVAGVKRDRYAFSIDGGYATTDGISAAASGTEPDGYDQWRVGGKARVNLTDTLSLVANARYADGKTQIDGYPAPDYVFADTPEYTTTRQFFGRAGLHYAGGPLTLDAGYALSDTRRRYYTGGADNAFEYGYNGRSERVELNGRYSLPADFALDFGADREWTRFDSTYDTRQNAHLTSGHAMLGWYTAKASLAAGVRYDEQSQFGSNVSLGANGTVEVVRGLRLNASYGEGFRAPTLYQLLSPDYGNAALDPERSRSYDLGVVYASQDGGFHAGVTLFRRDTRNLIAYVSCFMVESALCQGHAYGVYDNVGKARAQGVELDVGAALSSQVKGTIAYAYTEATDRTPGAATFGNDLARRPRHALTTSLDWTTPWAGLALAADLRFQSESFDNAANSIKLAGGSVTTVRASLPILHQAELFGRVENVFDRPLVTAAGYGALGRSVFGGVRLRY